MQIHSFDEMKAMLWFEWFRNTERNTLKVYLSSIDGYSQMHFFPIGDKKINI